MHFYSMSAICSAGNLPYHKEILQTLNLALECLAGFVLEKFCSEAGSDMQM